MAVSSGEKCKMESILEKCMNKLAICLAFTLVILCPCILFFCIKVAKEHERAIIFRLGRAKTGKASGPGMFFVLPIVDQFSLVDLRTVSFNVPPQEILTKDAVSVSVDAVIYYTINNPLFAVVRVYDYSESTRLLSSTTLHNVLGTKELAQLLTERDVIARTIKGILDASTDLWGVTVERVEIKDVRLPLALQRAMAAEAEARRDARAKIIVAEGEIKACKALQEAAQTLMSNPMALQLSYLQTLNAMSTEKNTIIFPFPMEVLKSILGFYPPK